MISSTRFGGLLREHRLRRGFSQEYLAEKAGISSEAISSLERGTRRAPYSSTVRLLVSALELDENESVELETAASHGRARSQQASAKQGLAGNNLPAQLSSFVGRDKDVAEIREAVENHRLVTLTGAAGIGKTRLALRIASELLEAGFEGVWFVDLASIAEVNLIPGVALSVLNVPPAPNREPLDTLIAYLKDKHVALILDNCEHLIDGAATTAGAILQNCPLVHVLATSREVLAISGERVVRLPALAVPPQENVDRLNVDAALEFGAVRLFVDRATDADSRFQFTEALVPAIAEICRRLDGVALAIELAAARVNTLSPGALVGSLDERFLVLTGGKRTAPPRHRTLRTLLDWSYQLLDEKAQRVLRELSVFVGGFSLELASALCERDRLIDEHETFEVLISLVDKSLVQVELRSDTARYRLLESTREYAGQALRKHGENARAARAHATAVLGLVERFSPWHFISDVVWKTQATPEIDNWRAALQWAFGSWGDVLVGQRLAAAVNDLWFSQAVEGSRWIRQAIDTCDERTPLALRAKLELAFVYLSYPLGRSQTGATRSAIERALQLFVQAGDRLGTAAARFFLGETLLFEGRVDESERLLRAARSAAEKSGANRLVSMATRYLGIARSHTGDFDAARELVRESVDMCKAGGAIIGQRVTQGQSLAELEFRVGHPGEALRLAVEFIETYSEYNRDYILCVVLNNAAAYAVVLARLDEALAYARRALDLATRAGFDMQVAWALQHLAAIAALRFGELGFAARALGFVDARLAEAEFEREYTERQEYDKIIAFMRNGMGAELGELMIEGACWSAREASENLDRTLRRRSFHRR